MAWPHLHRRPWQAVRTWQMGLASAGMGLFLFWLKTDEDGFIFLDHVNLAFHEAGHPIFGLFGRTWGLYGGTLGQLVFPVVAALAFWRQGEPVGLTVVTVWFFENFLNIARYMADARMQVLPLAGGGEHDWEHIFTRWNVLDHDATIAGIVATIGWIGMVGAWAWLGWRWWRGSDA